METKRKKLDRGMSRPDYKAWLARQVAASKAREAATVEASRVAAEKRGR